MESSIGMTHLGTDRRDQLRDALVEVFIAEGFRRFTLADLAARMHCSKTTLYALGQTKEQITINVVIRFFVSATTWVEAIAALTRDPADRIVAYLGAVADALRDASPAFMADLASHPATNAVYEQNTAAAARRVGEMIEQGIARGAFRKVHGAFVADTVAATMRRIQTGEVLAATGMHDAEAYDELAALVLTGIRS